VKLLPVLESIHVVEAGDESFGPGGIDRNSLLTHRCQFAAVDIIQVARNREWL